MNYELEATILGELGDPMLGERKECQKMYVFYQILSRTWIVMVSVNEFQIVKFTKKYNLYILDLQLPVQSVPITNNIVSSNPAHGKVYSIQH